MPLEVLIPGSGPGDGPFDPIMWTPDSLGAVVAGGGAAMTTQILTEKDPAGRPVFRATRTDSAATYAYATSGPKPSSLVVPAGSNVRVAGYVRANKAMTVGLPNLSVPTNGGSTVVNAGSLALTTPDVWVPFSFLRENTPNEISTQRFRWGFLGTGDSVGPAVIDIAFTLYK